MEQIYLVSIEVNAKSCVLKKRGYSFKKTAKGYIVDKESNFGGKVTRVPAGEILIIDSLIRSNSYSVIHFYTWCFEGQLKEAQANLKFAAKDKIDTIKSVIDNISKQFKQGSKAKL